MQLREGICSAFGDEVGGSGAPDIVQSDCLSREKVLRPGHRYHTVRERQLVLLAASTTGIGPFSPVKKNLCILIIHRSNNLFVYFRLEMLVLKCAENRY